jgi:OOP family OmpA-OmpF porin
MIKKTRLLAGLAIGCVLSSPAAFADDDELYKGFYFGVWGGGGSVDLQSRAAFDDVVVAALPLELDRSAFLADTDNDQIADTLYEFALAGIGDSELDDTISAWGVQVGYRFGKYFAAEVGYANLGEASYRLPIDVQVTFTDIGTGVSGSEVFPAERATVFTSAGPTISAIGMFPIGQRFDLQARAGIYLADTRVTNRIRDVEFAENVSHRRVDASQTELLAGIGGIWNINENFSLRAEYQKYFDVGDDEKTGESDIDVLTLSVLFK